MNLVAQDGRLARRVGALTLLVMAGIIAGFVFLLDQPALGAAVRIRVLFRHTAGLREQAALVVAGQPVGKVEAITPVPHGAPGPLAGEVGVAVTVAIRASSAWKVPAASDIVVASRGPLSDRYLEVAPPRGEPGAAVHDGQELRGIDPPSLDNVLQHTWTNMTIFQQFVQAVRPEATALRAQLDRLRAQLDAIAADPRAAGGPAAAVEAVRALVDTARHTYDTSLGGAAGLARIRAVAHDARLAIGDLRAAIDLVGPQLAALAADADRMRDHLAASQTFARAGEAIATVRAVLDKLDPVLANLDALGAQIASGEGSIGRIVRDPEFPEDAKDLGKVIKRQPWKLMEHGRD
jgi:ABC-type transporter Mla subunit MlaD